MSVKLLLVVLLLLVFAAILRSSCGALCGDDMYEALKSSDGRHEARLVRRSCGATTDFVTVVQVGVDDRYTDAVSVIGQGNILLEWRDSGRTLAVTLPPGYQGHESIPRTRDVSGVSVVVE